MNPNREVIVEAPADGRGAKAKDAPRRALTLLEKMHRGRNLDLAMYDAAEQLRNLHLLRQLPSEGISSYGLSAGRADPVRKGDRKAGRITGFEIELDGRITPYENCDPIAWHRDIERRYQDALFAMAGVITDGGEKVVDHAVVDIMLRVITDSEAPPTLTEIGQARASNKSDRQSSAVGASFIKETLHKLALHFRTAKGERWR